MNISARTLCHTDVAGLVDQALAVSGIDANRLELEVSEHVVASRLAERKLFELSALGVQLAIDDFGTGHSSLGQLKRFPFDAIKLDRSFVADLGDQPTQADVAILRAIVWMSADLGLRCIAEGVETKAQRRLLRFLRCHLMQGYLYGGPLEASEVPGILAGNKRPVVSAS